MTIDPDIIAYCLGELPPDAAAALEAKLAASPELRQHVHVCRTILGELRDLDAIRQEQSASAAGLARLYRIPEGHPPRSGIARGVRRVIADLVSPFETGGLVPGFRGQLADQQYRFISDLGSIVVKVEAPDAATRWLVGRLETQTDAVEVIATCGPDRRSAPIDTLGFFELQVAPGSWRLRIISTDVEVELPEIAVPE